MTDNPEIPPNPGIPFNQERLVLFVAFPGMCLLDLTGPLTVFWAASKYMRLRGLPGYKRLTVSMHGGLIPTIEGAPVQTLSLADFADAPIDTIVIPGSPDMVEALDDSIQLVAWLRSASLSARRTASVCSGAFMLAEAGLLDGKRAATHWAMCDMLSARFPLVAIEPDAIFVHDESIWTSAGVTAGIDLALALVEEDCGRDVAMQVARELVVFLRRPGGQSQYSEMLQVQAQDSAVFDQLHQWIADHLGREDMSVDVLAAKANMSPRNFARAYKLKTGRTPAKAVEIFRLEAARRLLEQSARNVDQIATQCGFGDEDRMRVTFQRNLGISPTDYRKRFSR